MTLNSTPLLGTASISAIAALASSPEDVKQACEDCDLPYIPVEPWDAYEFDTDGHPHVQWENAHLSAWYDTWAILEACDRTDRMVVIRILRFTRQLAELNLISHGQSESAGRRFLSLQKALVDDGFYFAIDGDPLKALDELAALATTATIETSAIRAELRRLEFALPNDPSAAIGRAKNLVEATAKAILTRHGVPVDKSLSVHALAVQAMDSLGAHPRDATNEPSRRILGRLVAAVQDLSELRNQAGDGHGTATVAIVEPRHGRLAVWAALAWCGFMLETEHLDSSGPLVTTA